MGESGHGQTQGEERLMKIIHVAGPSGTGKTRFICQLVQALKPLGPIGVVKHIGHHTFTLEPGKDTTLFFESGAAISAGIDREKSVIVAQENELSRVLSLLSDSGMRFAVVEGFKQESFQKIVFGKLPGAENVLLVEPSVGEVLSRLAEFPDFFTAKGLAGELRSSCEPEGATLVCTLSSPQSITDEKITAAGEDLAKVQRGIRGVSAISLRVGEENGTFTIYLGVCANNTGAAIEAARSATDLLLPLVSGEE
jgi:molybdopterin-guanine dinucleotide biosynthesis protein MobB